MKRVFITTVAVIVLAIGTGSANAATIAELQAQLQTLMAQITALQLQQAAAAPLSGAASSCPNLARNLSRGSRGSDVRELQQFLISQNLLSADSATGFFGPFTERAVQDWQSRNGIVSSGTPSTTGYGAVGPRTRLAITNTCQSSKPAIPEWFPQMSTPTTYPSTCVRRPPEPCAPGTTLTWDIDANGCRVNDRCVTKTETPVQTTQVTSAPTTYSWQTGGWSACTNATQSRTVSCVSSNNTTASDTSCTSARPTASQSCTITTTPQNQSCTFNNQTVLHGASVSTYQTQSVAYGQSCTQQTRTCTNGTLSGSYTYTSCSIASGPVATSCSGLTALNGSSADASSVIQACIDNASSGSVVELPAGKYTVAKQIKITKSLTLRTQGKTQSMPQCTLDDASCAQLIADLSLSEQWGVVTIGKNPPPAGGGLSNLTFDHIIINGNNRVRWNGPAGVQLAAPIMNTGIGHNLMVFDCSNCQFTNNVFKNGLSATAFGYGYVKTPDGYPAVYNHDVIISRNLIAYNGVHDRGLSWSDGFTFHDGDRFTITDNEFIDNTDGQLIMGGCTNCIIQRNKITNSGSFEGGSFVGLNLQAWIYPLTNGVQYSSGDFTGTDISNNIIDCSSNHRCGFGIYLGSRAWGFDPTILKGGYLHDNTITGAQQGLNVDTFIGTIFSKNTISNSGGVFYTNRGQRTMGQCNIAPGASITFSNNNIASSQCTNEPWDNPFEIPNWWIVPAAGIPSTPTGLIASCNASGTQATLSWNSSANATKYVIAVDDIGNQSSGCAAPTVTGTGGVCVSPSDYTNGNVTSPLTVTVTPGRNYSWWLQSGNAVGINPVPGIGSNFSCSAPPPPPDVPTGLTASCSSNGTQATFTWNPVQGATSYALRVNDTTNEAAGCTTPSVQGTNGICVSPTDYVYDLATSPTTLSVPTGKALSWWVHSIKPSGVSAAAIGTTLSCVAD